MQSLIGIQQRYIDTVTAGRSRWAHTKTGGHASRIEAGARRKAERELRKVGYTDARQISQIIGDARDMVKLAIDARAGLIPESDWEGQQ